MLRLSRFKALAVRRDSDGLHAESTVREPEACCAPASGEIANPTLFSPPYQTAGITLLVLTVWVVAYSNLLSFAETLFKAFPLERQTRAGEAVYFFLYEAPVVF